MSTKLSPERQKKADELGLPLKYNVEHSYILNSSGRIITQGCTDGTALKKIAESANRVLQLEQAVEWLRHMLEKCQLCDAEGFTWSAAHETSVGELLQQTEADHE